ncbi:MAG: hypothetical protein A2817_02235 [Candidatus Yanofskybacteria bacterium RIFCSPHIGHO2_01_FULL_39_8b]|uniref:Uncharacterized protein n=1 Tax=Candidatus Yanofskybacteria bacterium RIFCSPHIGHO2_01_FULL_39_8b TaxID=1802659 RepID=A0A1F8EH03_9BACT|nr:MAG: hypothetical protein A2817_02235 [Candidatus Yanofskybacteria bacterium RIFCSPHIGHO2_01_FULL_39_8b]
MKWTFAKTYAKTAPHEYVLQKNEPKTHRYIKEMIRKHGVWEEFCMPGGKPYQVHYWYRGRYRYWVIDNILNRTRVGWKYPKRLIG